MSIIDAFLKGTKAVNRIAIMAFCTVSATNAIATELTKEQRDKAALIWYGNIEKDMKAEFDSVVSEYNKHNLTLTPDELELNLQVIKTIQYNKAYIFATCLGEAMLDSSSPNASQSYKPITRNAWTNDCVMHK